MYDIITWNLERGDGLWRPKLEALVMAVRTGSFTRAAEVLGYTQSGLTHMMNSLEKDIGFPSWCAAATTSVSLLPGSGSCL